MLTNTIAIILELQKISESATIREWIEVGEESIFLVPADESGMKAIADAYQIMGKAYNAYTTTSTSIEAGHRLKIGDDYYDVKGRSLFQGSANVDNIMLVLEKLKE